MDNSNFDFHSNNIYPRKITMKEYRKESGGKNWKLWHGKSTYWQILTLCSFGITIGIIVILYWIGIPIL